MWPFPEHQSERLCFLPCLLRSLYSAVPPAPFFFFRNEVLFQDAQNLLEFDPNFENALSLPFFEKKVTKILHLVVMHLFLRSRQMMLQLHS